ncbi:hypothetical protein B0H21DRAFT_881447 [Amylocystis lapponica]|nr:hypothetical protein B0H21DRAFT_881447 [Amylocystis lapponica]
MISSPCGQVDQLSALNVSPPAHTDIVDTTRTIANLDQEISQMEQSLYSLKAHRNSLVPIFRLPPELISEIFIAHARDRKDTSSEDCSWIRVTHVCHHWRTIALQCPRLWTLITLKNTPWVAHSLTYSKNVPLVIELQAVKSSQLTSLEYVLKHGIGRVCEIILSSVQDQVVMISVWRGILSTPAPALHTFIMREPAEGGIYACYVPPVLFAAKTPALRHLELRQCSWCWSSSLFSAGVTTLILDACHVRTRPTLSEVLNMLARMPQLEHAELIDICPNIPWPLPITRTVALPHLQFLRVEALAFNAATLLQSLHLPAHPALTFACTSLSQRANIAEILHTVGDTLTSRPPTGALRSLTFTPGKHGLLVCAWSEPYSPEQMQSPDALSRPALKLLLSWRNAQPKDVTRLVMWVCRALPLGDLKTLYVPESIDLKSGAWMQYFGSAKEVETLRVKGHMAGHLLTALQGKTSCECGMDEPQPPEQPWHSEAEQELWQWHMQEEGGEQDGPQARLFPALQRLVFEDIDFAVDMCPDTSVFSQLQNCILNRKGELHVMFVHCRNFVAEQMADLRLFGAQVQYTPAEIDFDVGEFESESDDQEDYEDYYESLEVENVEEQHEDVDDEDEEEEEEEEEEEDEDEE